MFDDIDSVYRSLNWKADMKIINDFGEHVWLKPLYVDNNYKAVEPSHPEAKRSGITDCCFVNNPCDRHKKMQELEGVAGLN